MIVGWLRNLWSSLRGRRQARPMLWSEEEQARLKRIVQDMKTLQAYRHWEESGFPCPSPFPCKPPKTPEPEKDDQEAGR